MLNVAKLPFSASLGLINTETLTVNAIFLPAVPAGAYIGYKVLNYINIRRLGVLTRTTVLVAAVRLIVF